MSRDGGQMLHKAKRKRTEKEGAREKEREMFRLPANKVAVIKNVITSRHEAHFLQDVAKLDELPVSL